MRPRPSLRPSPAFLGTGFFTSLTVSIRTERSERVGVHGSSCQAYTKAMKATDFLKKIHLPEGFHLRGHHHSGALKWSRRGEQFTDHDYQVTEREVKVHEQLSAQSEVERLSN